MPMVATPPGPPPPADLADPLVGATRRVSWPPRVAEAALAVAAAAMTEAVIPPRPFCLALPAGFLPDDWKTIFDILLGMKNFLSRLPSFTSIRLFVSASALLQHGLQDLQQEGMVQNRIRRKAKKAPQATRLGPTSLSSRVLTYAVILH